MLSNTSTSYKLKASKSSHTLHYNHNDENYETDNAIIGSIDSNRRQIIYNSRDGRYKGARSRHTEFRHPTRMGPSIERRAFRGRGGPISRRERDFSDANSYSHNRKYHDALNRNSEFNSGMFYRSKCYEPDKKSEVRFNFPEDTRISKLLRRLSMESDPGNFLTISKKLLEVLLIPDNSTYVRKAFHILGDSMLDILRVAPGMISKKEAAKALGRMGYIMGQENDFIRFQDWLFARMSNENDDIRFLFMKALKETLEFEAKKHVLREHVEALINDLVTLIEILENANLFKCTVDVLLTLAEIYPDEFYVQFRDAVDIFLGWHVDLTQPISNIEFMSNNLQRIKGHFQSNLDFSTTLVYNFFDDISTAVKDFEKDKPKLQPKELKSTLNNITIYVLSLNTILKCLDDTLKPSGECITVNFISDSLIQLITTLKNALILYTHDNLIIAVNENIILLLNIIPEKTNLTHLSDIIFSLIYLEIEHLSNFKDSTVVSCLMMISKILKEFALLPKNLTDLVEKLIGPKSEIIKLRESPFQEVRNAAICMYQALLKVKNVSLLQDAYEYILGDLENIYKQIVPGAVLLHKKNPFENVDNKCKNLELSVLFLLHCLSELANVSSSIIGIWGLNPSMLEVLAVLLEPDNKELFIKAPCLQYSLFYLLFSHCKCYGYFIASSSLVTNMKNNINSTALLNLGDGLVLSDIPNTSPNSENFAIILDLLYKSLKTSTNCKTIDLILQSISDMLVYADCYLTTVYNTTKFEKLAHILIECGYNYNVPIVLSVCYNLDKLLRKKELSWTNAFLIGVSELCIFHMNSSNIEIRQNYTKLSENIPWDLTVMQFNKIYSVEQAKVKCKDLQTCNNYTVVLAQHLHLSGAIYGEMQPLHFMTFMKYLIKGEEKMHNWLENIFLCCCPNETGSITNVKNLDLFRNLALNSRAVINNWITFEAAQLCINLKLRTPLGKPNETFTSFETLLKQLTKDITKVKNNVEVNQKLVNTTQKRVQLFLQFMEHLEKGIYNAAEGCAIAMPPVSKPVKTFFHTNFSTCKEWLSRVRLMIINAALHIGQSTMVIRHGQAFLKHLVLCNKTQTSEFECTVMYLTWAYLNLKESEAILGLYTWCKKTANRKFEWVKYVADQANTKYEIAVANYKLMLDSKRDESTIEENEQDDANLSNKLEIDSKVQYFLYSQILNCYRELNCWTDASKLQSSDLNFEQNENGIKYSFFTSNKGYVQVLSDTEAIKAFAALNNWKEIADDGNSFNTFGIVKNVESNLYDIALNMNNCNSNVVTNNIVKNFGIIQEGVQDSLLIIPSDFLQSYLLNHYIINGLKSFLNNSLPSNVFLVSENFENDIEKIDSSVLTKILWWSEYFSHDHFNVGFNSFSSSLRLHVIRKARKEKNYSLATVHINKFLAQDEVLNMEFNEEIFSITDIGNMLLQKSSELSKCTIDLIKAVKETIKLLYAVEDNKQLVFDLCASASKAIYKNAELHCNQEMRQISSKILLKLSTWLHSNENTISLTEIGSPLVKLLMVLPEIGISEAIGTGIIPPNELAIGKLLHFSVHQCLSLAKNWFAFGSWCYRWGRKILNHHSNISSILSDEDKIAIQKCLPRNTTESDFMRIISTLSLNSICNEDDITSNTTNNLQLIQEELNQILSIYGVSSNHVMALIQIWKNSQKRTYSCYELSADAYFRYLQLVTNSDSVNKSTECNTITATLRLLHLIVKYALELQVVMDTGLASTPTEPWKIIIPQLFSHLNHPEAYVRQRVSEFLCRMANDAPHLIIFPAVVGAVEGGVKFNFSDISITNDCFSQNNSDDNELTEIEDIYESDMEESNNTVLQSSFKSMVDTLNKLAPETITQVQLLVKELRRITLLWDELWLGTLLQYQTEIIYRQHQMEIEIEKVNENKNLGNEEKISLITEKYRIIMKPIIFILEQLQDITGSEAETPHEKQFHEKYLNIIKETIEKLKNPDHPEKPQECWQPLKVLQNKFQQRAHKRAAYALKMSDVSPALANMKDTVIAMPGVAMLSKPPITITSVCNHISILPTKTKPKKLMFSGSDGQTYTYLFKGLEDLHLDERIMQFLSIANTMMANVSEDNSRNLYRARHYSVIPLGPRSGLIRWVDGTTPAFALYKRWQQRETIKMTSKTTSGQKTTSNNNVVLRPSELFYNKLNPLLQEHGVKNPESRKEWPLAILKQVLVELMKETPSNLLSQELWINSINTGEWWRVVKNYSCSIAVMSILGYIIGLGDRHLDNVLVDLSSGEVIHIDYNVCFEKGKTLRVPEKVPFRLTPNIVEALGLSGIEGIFRLACENILKTMKKGRETLLTLLEAFVYDPLVDWTVGGEELTGTIFRGITGNSRQSRKELEKEITLSMYNVRCTEIKTEWGTNRAVVLEEVTNGIEKLQSWITQQENVLATEDLLQDLHQQMTLLKEAEANEVDKHNLFSLPIRYSAYKKRQDTINEAVKELKSFLADIDLHMVSYSRALNVLDSHQYSQWIMELNISVEQESCHIFNLVTEFLQKSKSSLLAHCEQSENDIEHYRNQQTVVTTKCLHLLQEYSAVYTQFPPNYRDNHRMVYYCGWTKQLLENKKEATWEAVYNQLCSYKESLQVVLPAKPILEFSYHLNVQQKDISKLTSKLFEELSKVKESSNHIETIYNNAKLSISSFLRCEKDGFKALKYIILIELCKLNKEYLNYELNISRSGNYVLKLPASKGGDWLLDDLTWYSNNTVEFISHLLLSQTYIEDPIFTQSINIIQLVNNVYKSLQELYCSFHTIILPESMKKLLNEEQTVIHMIGELNSIVVNVGIPIADLITQLEKQLTCIVMEMEIEPSQFYILEVVSQLKARYQLMIHNQSENLSQGKMLLMGFNGLFDKLNIEFQNLMNALALLEVPGSWRKVDQVKQARDLCAPIFNIQVKSVLDNIFLLKRIQTMCEVFGNCIEMTNSFKTPITVTVLNDEQMDKPIKKFITDFITRQFLGIATESVGYNVCILLQSLGLNVASEIESKDIGAENKVSLEDLNKKGGALFLKQGVFNQNILAQVSNLEANLKSSWNLIQDIKQKEQRASLMESSLMRLQSQLSTYSWMYENILSSTSARGVASAPVRSKFLVNLQSEVANLNNTIVKMTEIREQQKSLILDINSRLNWAVGANPDVNKIMSAFDSAVLKRENRLEVEHQIATMVFNTCNSILQHELLRTSQSPEADVLDKRFLNMLQQTQTLFNVSELQIEQVTTTEENIMRLHTREMTNNPKWVEMISEKLSKIIGDTQKKLNEQKEGVFLIRDNVLNWTEKLRGHYTRHTKLMADIKSLIKPMSKIEEYSFNIQQFISVYKQYTFNFVTILNFFKKEIDVDELKNVLNSLIFLKENTDHVYDLLVTFEKLNKENSTEVNQGTLVIPTLKNYKHDSTTKVQERNTYAMGVWRRVRLKLEGRDPDPTRKSTIQEQVEYIIREATNLDNLALMYEGWTPWV